MATLYIGPRYCTKNDCIWVWQFFSSLYSWWKESTSKITQWLFAQVAILHFLVAFAMESNQIFSYSFNNQQDTNFGACINPISCEVIFDSQYQTWCFLEVLFALAVIFSVTFRISVTSFLFFTVELFYDKLSSSDSKII